MTADAFDTGINFQTEAPKKARMVGVEGIPGIAVGVRPIGGLRDTGDTNPFFPEMVQPVEAAA